jgi:hypothetical protein
VRRVEVHYIAADEDSKVKPTEHCLKRGEGRKRRSGDVTGGTLFQGTLCVYGIITMTSPHIIIVW